MAIIPIHPDFQIQEQHFTNVSEFLNYIQLYHPDDFIFLQQFLDSRTETITVKTSGSTGTPKTISLSKTAMLASAEATGTFFDLPAGTRALLCLSSDYIAGKMMWVRALHLGWHSIVVPVDSHPMQHTSDTFDFAAMVPLQVQQSLPELHRIKTLIIGGAPISYALKQELLQVSTHCYQTYGMTETITHIAVKEISNNPSKQYYKTLPNIQLSVDDRGCLLIDAPLLNPDPIVTNDIVKLISPNTFEWLGRYDNVINSGGVKLFPEQIEALLSPVFDKPFFIAALPDVKLGQKVVLVIESKQQIPDLNLQLLEVPLTRYENPKEIRYLPSFVYTKNNKINRKETLSLLRK